MKKSKKLIGGTAAVLVVAGVGTGVGFAASGDDDQALEPTARRRATAAALEHVGEGTVTETEIGDDGAAYGVEIRLGNGSEIEVELDAGFNVIGTEQDDDDGGAEGPDDD